MSPFHDPVRLINGERLTVLGWAPAILLQVAHPLIAAGVADHSGFRRGAVHALARLRSTVRAMLAISFGSEAERAAAIAGIRAIHDRVHGRLGVDVGPWSADARYSAHHPDLLLWVHVTLLDSVLRAYREMIGPLDPSAADEYVVAAAEGVAALGLPMDRVPRAAEAIARQVTEGVEGSMLAISPVAREIATAIVRPAGMTVLPFASHAQRLLAVGPLPPRVREMYGFAWTPTDDARLQRLHRTLRRLRRVTPDAIARFRAARPV